MQVLDDAALDSILANIAADRSRLGDKWPGIYAGREHFIYEDDQDSAALAWFKDFEKRADGIWARDDGLTPLGREAITNGSYKFTSFSANLSETQKLDGNKVRVLKLDTIGFTNQANGKELLTPITNRGTNAPGRASVPASRNPFVAPPHVGHAVYDAVVGLVVPRLKNDSKGYDMAHARVSVQNCDLCAPSYALQDTTRNFHLLTNRVENRAGLSPARAVARSADDIAALTRRFLPKFSNAPAAMRFDCLSRAADVLAQSGVPERLCNHTLSTARVRDTREAPHQAHDVSKSDWKAANAASADVLALLDEQATRPIDRGEILENAPASQVRGVFKGAIERLMREQGLDRRQAFDRLKADEPIFWTLAMLSFEPDPL